MSPDLTSAGATGFVRVLSLVRAAWGLALLLRPHDVLRRVHGLDADPVEVAVTRVLGARQLAQGVVTAWRPVPVLLLLGEGADVLHGATGVALAGLDPSRRRAGIVEAVVAGGFAAVTAAARG